MDETQREKVILLFGKHRDIFIRTGDRMCFGRMEGMMDWAEATGMDDLVKIFRSMVDERYDEMKANCG